MFFNVRTSKLRQEKALLPSTSSKQASKVPEHGTTSPQPWDQEYQAQGIVLFHNYEIFANYLTLLELTALTDKYSHLPPGAAVSTK